MRPFSRTPFSIVNVGTQRVSRSRCIGFGKTVHSVAMLPKSVKAFFQLLPQKFDQDAAEGVTAVYQFDLSGQEGGQYYLVVDEGACQVHEGRYPEPHVTFVMSAEDCLRVLEGQLDGPSVFLSGRLQVTGDLGLAMQLRAMFPALA
jgi:putative sterol carrier protein